MILQANYLSAENGNLNWECWYNEKNLLMSERPFRGNNHTIRPGEVVR